MEISVVYAVPEQQPWVNIEVPDDCTLAEAISLSGLANSYPDLDLNRLRVGIFGKLSTLETCLKPGDRVEIYQPLVRNLDDEDDDEDD